MSKLLLYFHLTMRKEQTDTDVPLVRVVGEGFFGSSEKLLPSRPELLHSFLSVAVGAEVSMLLFNFCHKLQRQDTHKNIRSKN